MADGLTWDTPPRDSKGQRKWTRIITELQDNIGKWAKLDEPLSRAMISMIRKQRVGSPSLYNVPGRIEVRYRTTNDYLTPSGQKKVDAWVRWAPPEDYD